MMCLKATNPRDSWQPWEPGRGLEQTLLTAQQGPTSHTRRQTSGSRTGDTFLLFKLPSRWDFLQQPSKRTV